MQGNYPVEIFLKSSKHNTLLRRSFKLGERPSVGDQLALMGIHQRRLKIISVTYHEFEDEWVVSCDTIELPDVHAHIAACKALVDYKWVIVGGNDLTGGLLT